MSFKVKKTSFSNQHWNMASGQSAEYFNALDSLYNEIILDIPSVEACEISLCDMYDRMKIGIDEVVGEKHN